MSTSQKEENNLHQFLAELSELTLKHGIAIGGCFCCGSPWLTTVDKSKAGCYGVSWGDVSQVKLDMCIGDQLEFIIKS